MLNRHTKNPSIGHYSAIFTHIQQLVHCLHTQKRSILGILEYSELYFDRIPTHIHYPVIFTKIYKHSELRNIQNPLKDLRWSFLQK